MDDAATDVDDVADADGVTVDELHPEQLPRDPEQLPHVSAQEEHVEKMRALLLQYGARQTEEDLKRAFSYLDTQQKGVVSVSDIQRGLALMGVRMTETDVVSAHLCVCVESACVDKICLMKHGQREN